jgi:hypothetical protein
VAGWMDRWINGKIEIGMIDKWMDGKMYGWEDG